MATFMRPYAAQTYALMRIVTGFLFLWHGAQTLLSIPHLHRLKFRRSSLRLQVRLNSSAARW